MPDASAIKWRRRRRYSVGRSTDVENALVNRVKFEEARAEQAKNVEALQCFRNLAELRYKEGTTIYLQVANTEQPLFNAQLQRVATPSRLFQSYASLYRAMGGGWVEDAEQFPRQEARPEHQVRTGKVVPFSMVLHRLISR